MPTPGVQNTTAAFPMADAQAIINAPSPTDPHWVDRQIATMMSTLRTAAAHGVIGEAQSEPAKGATLDALMRAAEKAFPGWELVYSSSSAMDPDFATVLVRKKELPACPPGRQPGGVLGAPATCREVIWD